MPKRKWEEQKDGFGNDGVGGLGFVVLCCVVFVL